ncbi:MAG TPA: hypothetical protein VJG30_03100 [Candidatus Nanoarchaeia archaeon]|nr:hypothetical protein [Candidatus Nanoarchaeia archaeon]
MADEKLVNAVKSNLSKGYSVDQIRRGLLDKGWPGFMIDEAIGQAAAKPQSPQSPSQPVNVEKKSSHLWLYIGIVFILIILVVGGFLVYSTYTKPVSISGIPSDEVSEFQGAGSLEEGFSSEQLGSEESFY